MANLTVWKFSRPDGASQALRTLKELKDEGLIVLHDGAIVEWPEGRNKPATRQLQDLVGPGALHGAFWGLLFGLLFFVPLLGMAVGAAMGALAGSMADVGIDDDFIDSVRSKVTPGTSALFVLTSDAVIDRVKEAFEGQQMELIQTNLSHEQEQALRDAFAE